MVLPERCTSAVLCFQENFRRIRATGDGHCLFRSLSFNEWGDDNKHVEMRRMIVAYVVEHWEEEKSTVQATYFDQYKTCTDYATGMGDEKKAQYGTEYE